MAEIFQKCHHRLKVLRFKLNQNCMCLRPSFVACDLKIVFMFKCL